ncbi:metal-sensitive transcriptional regulator [Streptomyces sp. NPDC051987]|uniref:metal-sensitive transcriptional regulator n=1 Tax=Streptomyces sp. NPDC051987 TaxID=3155808 RepID=UPI00342EA10F
MTTTEAGATTPSGSGASAATTHGYHKQKDEHLKRLRRIEGQIRGLQRMVDEDTYCIDILTQVSASTKALQSFALQLLEEHLRHCVADAAVKGGDEIDTKVEEATQAIARMLRT